jgi:actin-related protein
LLVDHAPLCQDQQPQQDEQVFFEQQLLQHREDMAEVMFETHGAQRVCIRNQALLALLSTGRVSGTVLDIGYNRSTILGVEQGSVRAAKVQSSSLSSSVLHGLLLQSVASAPSFLASPTSSARSVPLIKRLSASGLFELLPTILADMCFVTPVGAHTLARAGPHSTSLASASDSTKAYTLPDGTCVDLNDDMLSSVPEVFFDPQAASVRSGRGSCKNPSMASAQLTSATPIHELVSTFVEATDVEAAGRNCSTRRAVDVLVHGGAGRIRGFVERLEREVNGRLRRQHQKHASAASSGWCADPSDDLTLLSSSSLASAPSTMARIRGPPAAMTLKGLASNSVTTFGSTVPVFNLPTSAASSSAERGKHVPTVSMKLATEHAAWEGGSIFSSLNCFKSMCLTAAEYNEEGPKAIHRYSEYTF